MRIKKEMKIKAPFETGQSSKPMPLKAFALKMTVTPLIVAITFITIGYILPQSFWVKWLDRHDYLDVAETETVFATSAVKPMVLAEGEVINSTDLPLQHHNYRYYRVIAVVDYKTLKVSHNNKVLYMELIGVGDPKGRTPEQAAEALATLVAEQKVRFQWDNLLVNDDTSCQRVYAFLEDGNFINEILLSKGICTYEDDGVSTRHTGLLAAAASCDDEGPSQKEELSES